MKKKRGRWRRVIRRHRQYRNGKEAKEREEEMIKKTPETRNSSRDARRG